MKILSLQILFAILLIIPLTLIPWGDPAYKDWGVILTFIINGTLWGVFLFCELLKRPYSLFAFHWFFCFLLFFLAALSQYMHGIFPWGVRVNEDILLETNLILLFWTICVWFGYKTKFSKKQNIQIKQESLFRVPSWLVFILTSITLLNTLYRIATIGFGALLARATAKMSYGVESSAIILLLGHMLQAISFFAAVFAFVYYKQKRKGFLLMTITFGCLLVSYFPTALSRSAASTIYGGLLLIMFKSLRRNRLFILALMGGFLILLPFLSVFRNLSFNNVNIIDTFLKVFSHLSDVWLSGDYDAYAMLMVTVEYVKYYGITWGWQLLGVFLFWIPREWWPSKPVGTGSFMSEQMGWPFTNISAPLPAEGIINFGVGVFLFAIALGWFIRKLDFVYWDNLDRTGKVIREYDILYPELIMFFFFINRGDLLSSTAYTMCYVVIWWFLCRCCKKIKLN